MAERVIAGVPAAPGVAAGRARVLGAPVGVAVAPLAPAERPGEAQRAIAALEATVAELVALAASLRSGGRDEDAELVDTSALMAADPALLARVRELVGDRGLSAPAAIQAAAGEQAGVIAAIPDETLAARADDVRSLGRRAARLAQGAVDGPSAAGDTVLVADELGPADVAELGHGVVAIALARGSATAHAAIVARSLGVPMIVRAGDALHALPEGSPVVVDGSAGIAVADPDAARIADARRAGRRRAGVRERAIADRDLPAVTPDGRRIAVLANVVSPADVQAALDCGAEGAGLIRTELAFLDATAWPDEAEHRRVLGPVLGALRGRPATVRVLDFGGDKTPPFLRGARARGLALLLEHSPAALAAQLRAAVDAGRDTQLRILLPLVRDAAELQAAAALLDEAIAATGAPRPLLGAMVETPGAADRATELAAHADFLSIGTNDLTHETLGTDRFAGDEAVTHDPRVLRHIAACARAGRPLEVCGEAASSPLTVPLLIGLGVDELSVGAARVGTVRAWVRATRHDDARTLAAAALAAPDAAAVGRLAGPAAARLELVERGDAGAEDADRLGGVVPVRP